MKMTLELCMISCEDLLVGTVRPLRVVNTGSLTVPVF